jgi:antitoxin component of MazEF toxin-antitoxin module
MSRRYRRVMSRRTGTAIRIGRSLAVILPKDWTRGNELEAGDRILIEYDSDVRVSILSKPGRSLAEATPDA